MKIIKLSDSLIKQIAAGEVIAHPANALKEVIENAIDAKSENITIHITKSGLEKIVVIDDGEGIDLDDLKICSALHTTSKTKQDDHVFGAHTLGFRGEALASIDAISDLTISSKNYSINKQNIAPSTFEGGTKIEILNMFANLPARLKFLKNSNIEWSLIKQTIQKYLILHPEINWVVFNNEKKFWNYPAVSLNDRLLQIFEDKFMEFAHTFANIKISGYLFKTHKNAAYLYVNGRPIKDKAIFNYMNSIFKEFFMKHENPSYVMFVETDPFFVDCNVNPTKDEVRFISYSNIFSMLSYIFEPGMFREFNAPAHLKFGDFKPSMNVVSQSDSPVSFVNESSDDDFEQFINQQNNSVPSSSFSPIAPIFEKAIPQVDIFASIRGENKNANQNAELKIIGQIKNSFIVFETGQGIGVFDQHAAHEREIYEIMKQELSATNVQKLLMPQMLDLFDEQKEYVQKNLEKFKNKGLIIENFAITHVPTVLNEADFVDFFKKEIANDVSCEILLDRLLADVACKKALKANTSLSHEQCFALLQTALKNIPICNHGRPVFKYFSMSEIGNWFKR